MTPAHNDSTPLRCSVVFPTGMLGSGARADMVARGVEFGAHAIAVDAGSTDSGPYYLGAAEAKNSDAALKRDLRILLLAAQRAAIPLIVGSCGTSGTDAGVDKVASLVTEIDSEEGLSLRVACIYSEQTQETILELLDAGRITPLTPAKNLTPEIVEACAHIVAVMGHEPIADALAQGANVVLAGRASDTSLVASIALTRGLPPGPAWHAAKTVECGDLCSTTPNGGGAFVTIDVDGFSVEPLDPDSACTPTSVAAHMLYENADPYRLAEPSGVLDTTDATYTALDDRVVRVEGSRFEHTNAPTIKLEGAGIVGFETTSFVAIADPAVLPRIDEWIASLQVRLRDRVTDVLGLAPDTYRVGLRCYGRDAVLGAMSANGHTPSEVGILMKVRAPNQATATAIAKTANPLLLHLPLSDMNHLPSFAFATSPAESERGASYEFQLNHVVAVTDARDMFRTVITNVGGI